MRIAFAPAGARSAADAVAIARHAEQLGFDETWVSEDYLERGAIAVASAIAAATSRIQVGIGVINPWTRHVAVSAMEIAALAEIAAERLIVGLGASNKKWMQDQLGIPFQRPLSTLVDYAEALRTLLRGEPLRREVTGLTVNAQLSFTPRSPPHIVLGVKGPKALAAAHDTDGVMLSVLASPRYASWIRDTYQPDDITAYALLNDGGAPSAVRDQVAQRTAHFIGLHGASPITELAGMPPEQADLFRERFLAGTPATDLLTDETLAAFTISGTHADCATRITEFGRAGVDSLVIMDDGAGDPFERLETAAAIALDTPGGLEHG